MSISPWAMLMMPIRPKVTASPRLMISSTAARLMPLNRYPTMLRWATNRSMSWSAARVAARGLRGLPGRVRDRGPGDAVETAAVPGEAPRPFPRVERPVLEGPQEALARRVARPRKLAERTLLGRRCGEPTRHRFQIRRAGPGGRDAAQPGQHPRRREDDRDRAAYDLSDNHIREPPSTSKEPLPPLLQSQSRPGYVTPLHGAGLTHDLVFQTPSN